MENDFRAMRRGRQQLSGEESWNVLKAATSGVLSLVGDGGYPYGVPLSFAVEGDVIYFHSALSGHKIDALKADGKACFTVIVQDEIVPERFTTYFKSIIAFGQAEIVEDESERLKAAELLAEKYSPQVSEESKREEIEKGLPRMLIIKMLVEHLTGKEAIELVKARGTATKA